MLPIVTLYQFCPGKYITFQPRCHNRGNRGHRDVNAIIIELPKPLRHVTDVWHFRRLGLGIIVSIVSLDVGDWHLHMQVSTPTCVHDRFIHVTLKSWLNLKLQQNLVSFLFVSPTLSFVKNLGGFSPLSSHLSTPLLYTKCCLTLLSFCLSKE